MATRSGRADCRSCQCQAMWSEDEQARAALGGAGGCGACLGRAGGGGGASPGAADTLALLTGLQMREEFLRLCYACEASIAHVQRFQKLVRNSGRRLHEFWKKWELSRETALTLPLNNNRLSNSTMVLSEIPGDTTVLPPKRSELGKIFRISLSTDVSYDRDNYSIELATDTLSEEMKPSRVYILNMEHDSDESDDEALSTLRGKIKLEPDLECELNSDGVCSDGTEERMVKKKKKMSKSRFKEVNVNENGTPSHLEKRERDGDTKNKRARGRKGEGKLKAEKTKGRQNERFKKVTVLEEAMLEGREADRRVKWYVQGTHKCDTCIIGYYNERHLAEHNRVKHDQSNPFACPICAVRLPTETQLARHAALHYRRIECRLCGEQHRAYRDMWRHYVSRHEPGKTFPCAHCGKEFDTRPSLVYHQRCDHRERAKCEYCGNTFRNQTTYKRHLLIHTGMPTYECKLCDRSYRGKFGYLTHMKTHGPPPKDAYCVECNVQFKHAFQYRRHLKISPKHAEVTRSEQCKKYECTACEKKFVSPSVLKRHYDSVHLKLKRYNCDKCDKNYATPAALWTHHKRQHERVVIPRDKVCEVCGKGFPSNTTLVDHMRSHTGERPYSCDVCAATFRHNSGLYMHKRLIHKMGKKRQAVKGAAVPDNIRTGLPFQCKLCPATFRHTSGLYMHNRLLHKNGAKVKESV